MSGTIRRRELNIIRNIPLASRGVSRERILRNSSQIWRCGGVNNENYVLENIALR